MDFNTGSSGSSGPPPPPRNEPSASSSGVSAGEFNLSDPVQSFISTVRGMVLNPVGFFRGMRKSGDFVNPLVFTLICALVGGILAGVLTFLFTLIVGDFLDAFLQLILQPIFYVIVAAIGVFVGSGVIHLLVMLLAGQSNAGFEATFRVGAYLGFLYLVSWLGAIPLLGLILTIPITIWYIVLGVLGIREAHSTTTGRAAAIVLIPVGVVLLLTLVVVVILIIAGAALLQQQQGF
ncbi:MAG: YIP1 family protein [Rubrobacteraceae bacterium]